MEKKQQENRADKRPADVGCFPMFIDLWKKKIVVVGAGTIAKRRIHTLLLFGADLWIVAPVALEEAIALAEEFEAKKAIVFYEERELFQTDRESTCANRGTVNILCKSYDASVCNGAFMVLAATDDEMLNTRICRDAKTVGAYVNNASDHHQCDFYFPSVVKQGDHVIGINGGGQDHAGTKRLRQKIETVMEHTTTE